MISIGVAITFAVIGSTILYKVVNAITELRADETEEINGLDITEHGERGYNVGLFTGTPSFFSAAETDAVKFFPTVHGSQD